MSIWNSSTEQLLRERWLKSSAAQIARAIGNGCTRNAVIGKAHRLGLSPAPARRTEQPRAHVSLVRDAEF